MLHLFFSLDILTLARENIFKLEGSLRQQYPRNTRLEASFSHIVFFSLFCALYSYVILRKNRFLYVDLNIIVSVVYAQLESSFITLYNRTRIGGKRVIAVVVVGSIHAKLTKACGDQVTDFVENCTSLQFYYMFS